MIRGPVLPQLRDSFWALVSPRLDAIERGLTLVLEGLDCSAGNFGLVDGFARDAQGAPVLVILAVDGDSLLAARVLSACEFLARVGDSLVAAVPEANLSSGAGGRVFVVGSEASAVSLEQLRRLSLHGLQVCRLEPFRLAGTERFAVRWLTTSAVPPTCTAPEPVPEFGVSPQRREDWVALRQLCERIDAGVRIDGDRFWRRISWNGSVLGEVWSAGSELRADAADGTQFVICGAADVRAFGDRVLRQYARLVGLDAPHSPPGDAGVPAAVRDLSSRLASHPRGGSNKTSGDNLRSALVAARLSPEEYSALGGPVSMAGGEADAAAMVDDVARIVAAQEHAWPPLRRMD